MGCGPRRVAEARCRRRDAARAPDAAPARGQCIDQAGQGRRGARADRYRDRAGAREAETNFARLARQGRRKVGDMRLFHRLERALGRYALPNLALYLIGGQVIFFSLSLLAQFDVRRIMLWPALVMEGDWWRLFTFVLVPPTSGQLTMTAALFLAISWYFFYMISQSLENYW